MVAGSREVIETERFMLPGVRFEPEEGAYRKP
jgi:hypothetical protein